MRWSCLQFNIYCCCRNHTDVCLLKQGGSRYSPPPPTRPGRILDFFFARYRVCITKSSRNSRRCRKHGRITVYSSARFSGSSLTFSFWTVLFSFGIVYSRVKRTPESEKKKTSVYLIKRKIKTKTLVYVLLIGVNSNPSSIERLFLRTANPRQDPNSDVHG